MEAPLHSDRDDRCSFCDRLPSQVGPLTPGKQGAFICRLCAQQLYFKNRERLERPPPMSKPPPLRGNFHRFTERLRQVLLLAQEEARRFNHNFIGTEHLLLGLVREGEGVGAEVLSNLGIELSRVRSAVEPIIGRGESEPMGEIGLTPRAKKVIALAIEEASSLGHHYIGTEHLLLGLIREGEGIAANVLKSVGLSLGTVREEVVRVAGGPGRPER